MKYRSDIDGLRAVAVLSVVAYHALPNALPGGFAGVDIFFVISGYLISTIIMREKDEGRFSLLDFYARRIKRLFPALIVMLAVTVVLGWFYLLPHEFRNLGRHLTSGAGYFLNFTLKKEAGYFDVSAAEKPLLHLWSLAVEEQFYIVWPVLLLMFAGRRQLLGVLVAITAASLISNLIVIHKNPAGAFYLPQNRFWELSSGALLAYANLYGSLLKTSVHARNAASLTGLALVLGAIFGLNAQIIYPGAWALIPCCGALLILAAGQEAIVNKWLLSNAAIVFIGLVSYPLYLWHWPLLSFSSILGFGGETAVRLGAVAAAFVLAVLTYYYVERPLRYAHNMAVVKSLMAATLSFCLFGLLASTSAFAPRLNSAQQRDIGEAIADWRFPKGLRRVDARSGILVYEAGSGARKVLYFGDSNMEQYWPRIERRLGEMVPAPSVVFVTSGGCLPIPAVSETHHPNCAKFAETAIALAQDPVIKTVVIAATWYGYFSGSSYRVEGVSGPLSLGTPAGDEALVRLSGMIRQFKAEGKAVWFVLDMPTGSELEPVANIRRTLSGGADIAALRLDRAKFESVWAPIRAKLTDVAATAGANIIDPTALLCDTTACPGQTTEGVLIYKDGGRLRSSYVRDHASFLDVTLEPGN